MNHISKALRGVADKYNGVSLIIRIIVGLIAGTALALVVPHMTWIGEFGTLFVSAIEGRRSDSGVCAGGKRFGSRQFQA